MLMPFGKYQGCYVEDLPQNYLRWLWENIDLREPLLSAVQDSLQETMDIVKHPDRDTLKRVYREMARKWHPDRGGSTTAMQAVNDFYERLVVS